MKTLSQVRSQITAGLKAIHGLCNVKLSRGQIRWFVPSPDSPALRWVDVSDVSDLPSEFIRFRNDTVPRLAKVSRFEERREIPKFELTVLCAEITDEFIPQLSQFVSANST